MTKEQVTKIIEIINEEVQKVVENSKNENSNYYDYTYLNLGDGRVIRFKYDYSKRYNFGTTSIYIAEYNESFKEYFDKAYIDFDTDNEIRLLLVDNIMENFLGHY